MSAVRIGLIFTALFIFVGGAAGCAAPQRQTMPTIVVAPGLKERLAWMDRVRLHDEGRQTMMEAQVVVRDDEDFVVDETDELVGDALQQPPVDAQQARPRVRVRVVQ